MQSSHVVFTPLSVASESWMRDGELYVEDAASFGTTGTQSLPVENDHRRNNSNNNNHIRLLKM